MGEGGESQPGQTAKEGNVCGPARKGGDPPDILAQFAKLHSFGIDIGKVCFVFENATGKWANSVFISWRKGKEEAEAVNLVSPFFPLPSAAFISSFIAKSALSTMGSRKACKFPAA